MIRLLLFLALCLPIFGNSEGWEGDSLDYAGLTIRCKFGCGDFSDPRMEKIYEIFNSTIEAVFEENKFTLLDDEMEGRWVTPWIINDCEYKIYNWQIAKGKWIPNNRNSFSLYSHSSFQDLATCLQKDLSFFYVSAPKILIKSHQELIRKLRAGYKKGYQCVEIWGEEIEFGISSFGECTGRHIKLVIESLQREIKQQEEEFSSEIYENAKTLVEDSIQEIDSIFKSIFVYCLEHHQEEGIRFKAALENLIIGDFEEAFDQILFLIDLAEKDNLGNDLTSKLYLLKGQIQSEFSLYADAIVALSTSIQKNAAHKEAYLERAAAYFELGEFDKAIEDFLESGLHTAGRKQKTFWKTSTEISTGITAGILEGGSQSLINFFPEMLGSFRGLMRGLWAFAKHPIATSNEFSDTIVKCVQYLKDNSTLETVQKMVPELKQLVQNYDRLEDYDKGKLIGLIVGKYGIDILACKYSVKTVKMYTDLRRANQLMTLEALASPATTQKILAEAGRQWAHREAVLKNGALKVDWGKQGKHIVNDINYVPQKNKSIWACSPKKTEQLINEYAGTGRKAHNSFVEIPGAAGYQEVVNFNEFIGWAVEKKTGKTTPTTWGKIHYSKNGIHIVPYLKKQRGINGI